MQDNPSAEEAAIDVDVVVVSFNSRNELRDCVEGLTAVAGVSVIVVDNASTDGCLETLQGLPVTILAQQENHGFAHGCNAGWRRGHARHVLFLNPDARVTPASLGALVAALEREPRIGAVAPRIHDADGTLDYSMRRYPRLRSTFARALFLHRLFPAAAWTDELVRVASEYDAPRRPDWVSGACVLVRREVLEALGGMDERFFMYCEDIDLCKRVVDEGWELVFEPSALVVHEGGASAPRTTLIPVLASSRIRYAAKHLSRARALAERAGVALEAVTHMVVARGGVAARRGHARALRVAVSPVNSPLAERLGRPPARVADAGRTAVVGPTGLG